MTVGTTSMRLVGVVTRIHQLLEKSLSETPDPTRANAWQVASTRLELLAAQLLEIEGTDAWEDTLTDEGLVGPEIDFLCDSFEAGLAGRSDLAMHVAAIFLESLAWLPGVGVHARPVSTFIRISLLRAV